jgi:Holliday junction resolvasome RuvABC endonuclease subunit
MIAIGIDPSLTCTGLAVWDGERFHTAAFPSKPIVPHANLLQQHLRIDAVQSRFRERLGSFTALLPEVDEAIVATEELPKTRTQGKAYDRAAHMWKLLDNVRSFMHVSVAIEVNPMTLKKFSTGYGAAGKGDMVAMAKRLYGVHCKTDDEADAVHLAAAAAAAAGHPVPGWQGTATPDRADSFALVQAAYDAATAG